MNKNAPLAFMSLCVILLLPALTAGQDNPMKKKIPDFSRQERREVPAEYTWKVEDLFASEADWQAEKEKVNGQIAQIDATAKGWTASPQAMLALLDLVSGIELRGSRLMSYASHQHDTDMGNTRFQAMSGEVRTLFVQMSSKLSFLQPDVLALGAEKFAAYLKAEPKLAAYRFNIESILREKDHVLPSDQQRIAALTGLFAGVPAGASSMLNNVEAPRTEITLSDGQKVLLDQAAYQRLRASKNPADRTFFLKIGYALGV